MYNTTCEMVRVCGVPQFDVGLRVRAPAEQDLADVDGARGKEVVSGEVLGKLRYLDDVGGSRRSSVSH